VPAGLRKLFGRDRDVVELGQLIGEARVVTLTGPGGVGKTALALEAATQHAQDFADGVYIAELASVTDAAFIPSALAEVLSLRAQTGVAPTELVVRALAQQNALVVLDNCEHVLEAVSPIVDKLMHHCPGVTVLATSREALGVPGEHTYEVRPLPTAAGVLLFQEVLSQRHGAVAATPSDVAMVAELCDRLDGLPLAIELAAARTWSMPLDELFARLNERFRLLRGSRTVLPRHQTLRETVAWSYDLLTDTERRVFEQLSVFAGGFSLGAAEAVCADDAFDDIDVDTVVAGLVDKSMVVPDPSGRYLLLETLRQFGEERLRRHGDSERSRDRHLAHYARFVRAAHDGLLTASEHQWWQRLQGEWANIRAAFAWACQTGDIAAAATIAINLIGAAHWHDTGEPYSWAQQVLALPGADTSELAASILAANAWAAWERGELGAALELGRRALAVERPGQPNIDYYAEFAILSAAHFRGDVDQTSTFIDRAATRARHDNQTTLESIFVSARAIWLINQGRADEARVAASQARQLAGVSGNPSALTWAMDLEAWAMAGRDPSAALALLEEALALAQANDLTLAGWLAQFRLAPLLVENGRVGDAIDHVVAGLSSMRRRSSWMFARQILVEAAKLLHMSGDEEAAATVYGAIRSSNIMRLPEYAASAQSLHRTLAGTFGDDHLETLASYGERSPIERIVTLAESALVAQRSTTDTRPTAARDSSATSIAAEEDSGTLDVTES
jgi:predicted ATPase